MWECGHMGRTDVLIYLVITIDRSYIFKGPKSLLR